MTADYAQAFTEDEIAALWETHAMDNPSCDTCRWLATLTDLGAPGGALAAPPVPAGPDERKCGADLGPHWNPGACLLPAGHSGGHDDRALATPPVPAGDERERLAALLWVTEYSGTAASWPPIHEEDARHFLLWADRLLAAGVRLTEGGNK